MPELLALNHLGPALVTVTFLAALLQSATGFGFGMIVGPILLAFLSGQDAVQATGILTFGIVLILAPALFRQSDRNALMLLVAGTVVGLPLGYIFLSSVPEVFLKVAAALVVTGVLVNLLRPQPAMGHEPGQYQRRQSKTWLAVAIGTLSGAMSTALAMPGPPVMGYLSRLGLDKDAIRSTLAVLMVGSYAGMIGSHLIFHGISDAAIVQATTLAPPTLVGLIAGHILAARISKRMFHVLSLILMIGALLSLGVAIGLMVTAS